NKQYFIKRHWGVGWKEIFKSLFKLQKPILSTKDEYRAICHLERAGVSVPKVFGVGYRGWNPAKIQSFIILEALTHTCSVNDLLLQWKQTGVPFNTKYRLIKRIAEIVSRMHASGLNHRDCYLLHFLMDERKEFDPLMPIYVIDLHRAQIRKKVPERWLIKDLAGLYFSSMNITLTRNDLFRFMKAYRHSSLRTIWPLERSFWLTVKKRAEQLFKKRAIQ
ncbi:MAG: lipopolysaccharide core heptose(I) kinase RfaP, partial [Gammaproteobacteria bacterium]|nr:lipopolysaccharide core heptose(I) kinase RfaP [Gammaproteobacteria bacterium]